MTTFYALKDKKTGLYKEKGVGDFRQSKIPSLYTKGMALAVQRLKNKQICYPYPSGTPREERLPIKQYDYVLVEIYVED